MVESLPVMKKPDGSRWQAVMAWTEESEESKSSSAQTAANSEKKGDKPDEASEAQAIKNSVD